MEDVASICRNSLCTSPVLRKAVKIGVSFLAGGFCGIYLFHLVLSALPTTDFKSLGASNETSAIFVAKTDSEDSETGVAFTIDDSDKSQETERASHVKPVSDTNDHPLGQKIAHSGNERCQKRLPQCIVFGIAKSGSGALAAFLNHHPQIAAVVNPPETHFFEDHYRQGLGWYRNKMPCSYSDQVTMEKTPAYYVCPECPKRIHEMNKDIKLMLIVKDPITRTQSHYALEKHYLEKHHKVKDQAPSFEAMLSDPRTGELNLGHKIFNYSNYTFHLRHWLSYFSMDQIHVVDGLRFERNPAAELIKVEQFLEVKPFFRKDNFVLNKDKGKYCFTRGHGMACLPSCKGRPHPTIPPKMLETLKKHFHPMNEEFYGLIGRRFDWGY